MKRVDSCLNHSISPRLISGLPQADDEREDMDDGVTESGHHAATVLHDELAKLSNENIQNDSAAVHELVESVVERLFPAFDACEKGNLPEFMVRGRR